MIEYLVTLGIVAAVGIAIVLALAVVLQRADARRWDPPARPSTGPDSIGCWWPGCAHTSRTAVIHRTSPKGPGCTFEGLCPDHMAEWQHVRETVDP